MDAVAFMGPLWYDGSIISPPAVPITEGISIGGAPVRLGRHPVRGHAAMVQTVGSLCGKAVVPVSKIAQAIKLETQPVAVVTAKSCPEGALQFRRGVWGCVVALLNAASRGKTAAFHRDNVSCPGGRAGLGLQRLEPGTIEYFLSTGGRGPKPGEFYKGSPDLALKYVENMPGIETEHYVVMKPLAELRVGEEPEIVIFLVNVDQLSGLATLANFDRPSQDNVRLLFGSGCAQSVLYGLDASRRGESICYVGLTDPSARKCIQKDILSFTIPYRRYLQMEKNVDKSFLCTETWNTIAERI